MWIILSCSLHIIFWLCAFVCVCLCLGGLGVEGRKRKKGRERRKEGGREEGERELFFKDIETM